jgi:lysophospholipase L1-like esterase
MMKRMGLVVLGIITLCLNVPGKQIAPEHDSIRYVGRFTEDYRFGWTGCMIETDFTGSEISAELDVVDGPAAGITVVIDGEPHFLKILKGRKTYVLATELDRNKTHRIALFKRSEGALGTVQFNGFQIPNDGRLFRPKAPGRRMLVIGDSITCGYGNEAKTLDEGNTVENENGYRSYAPIAARALDADLMMFCWSGRGLFRNRQLHDDQATTIPKIFNQTLPMDGEIEWDHSRYIPDVVVINLGTNDAAEQKGKKEPLLKEGFLTAYKKFISRLRGYYPSSKIIVSIGPMNSGPVAEWLPEVASEFEHVSLLVYPPFNGDADVGGHYHPSVKKDKAMAEKLVSAIEGLTGWNTRHKDEGKEI